jgi:hypothetical protein
MADLMRLKYAEISWMIETYHRGSQGCYQQHMLAKPIYNTESINLYATA